ncbi:nuclear transport factor 2 family protein [Bradyrhizobium sp. ISRA426]|uniref:nuclear transport factor 2 family protein n=1 Tax=Bradyrhizobium sp. ISRA426 TaxID=2866191 RepID=UPI002478720E|nr:nuclear transport factor 2 family protein [Bradyrhizobium sp. ISRA426]WGR73115.1 nuclear transport factor 2 family protein [Bradyrhizobium sp. ISRA426]
MNNDVATLDQLLSDKLVYTHSNGQRDTKEQYLGHVESGHFKYFAIARPEEEIRVFGDMAMVVGRMVARVAVAGSERQLDNRSLAIWIRQDGQWSLLAYQPTPIPRTT